MIAKINHNISAASRESEDWQGKERDNRTKETPGLKELFGSKRQKSRVI